jgi:hypothetical protein
MTWLTARAAELYGTLGLGEQPCADDYREENIRDIEQSLREAIEAACHVCEDCDEMYAREAVEYIRRELLGEP